MQPLYIQSVVDFINKYQIDFHRGEVTSYFQRISHLNQEFSLPQADPAKKEESLVRKNLFVLWNIMIDDEVDREGKNTTLKDSFAFWSGGKTVNPTSEILSLIMGPESANTNYTTLKQDLFEVAKGFEYEYQINHENVIVNQKDYLDRSTLTASILPLLDLDLFYTDNTNQLPLEKLRQAFSHIGKAIKLSSDIGSFAREVSQEKNLNLILVKLIEETNLNQERVFEKMHHYQPILKKMAEEVQKMAFVELDTACKLIQPLGQDYERIVAMAKSVVERYSGGIDIFFDKK